MAYDEGLAERIRDVLSNHCQFEEKLMFGGICFMVNGHMCAGVVSDTLMARVGPEQYSEALKKKHARKMNFTGRPLKGMVYVEVAGIRASKALTQWILLCLEFVSTLPPKK
ncbi:MAG: TfoX/Sxy family protein [Deltaproteobacteria bacterium]|nr:TfoX/Sxy family protein [Deltaproteobacteria bacterium]